MAEESFYSWLPTYREINKKLHTYPLAELVPIVRQLEIENGLTDRDAEKDFNSFEVAEIDPFTFLSLVNKYGDRKRVELLQKLHNLWNLQVSIPTDVHGLPTANAQNAWWFGYQYRRKPNDIKDLRTLFIQTLNGKITEEAFQKVLNIRGVGYAKLTEGLFYVDPEKYLPINGQTEPYLKKRGIRNSFKTLEDYRLILQQVRDKIQKPFYEISHEAYKENKKIAYWIFQGNPDIYNIKDALRDEHLKTWRITAYAHKIKLNDKVILWVTGNQGGCYALAEVASDVYEGAEEEIEKSYYSDINSSVFGKRVAITVTKNLIESPIVRDQVKNNPAFDKFMGGKQGTNFKATQEQYELFEQLIAEKESSSALMKQTVKYSKNIILYGPPGTGKTYATIDLAVEIVDGVSNSNHRQNKQRFDELLDDQIEFITFHQNYTYEDFVIGIKPDLDDEGTGLQFRRHEGIFYKIAKRAQQNYEVSKVSGATTGLRPFDEVLNELIQPLVEKGKAVAIPMPSGIEFKLDRFSAARVHIAKARGSTDHWLSFETMKLLYEEIIPMPTGGMKTYYKPIIELLQQNGKIKVSATPKKNYVLIIDEINRANMSRVFGELITLLEEDKRMGGENEIRLLLPSGERFALPPNLYILGTMNTADKSLALLDVALRRRFEFIGKYPQYEVAGLDQDVASILIKLNEAIHKQKQSADFLIGHAYFIGKRNGQLKEVFQNRVIPLLMEYFNGRTDLVANLLEQANIRTKRNNATYQLEIEDDEL
ncbi:AAA family ATPase [Telluribacter sp. SYSU D00476]|uniref:McrB family protein n=1 Tax=Telluribacter sp. SYSU D00476 TaxID=2811430 RepID=UPI00286E2200|nr:AAA family ATPase [Telluribacter sp. SYSU D00476]